MLVNLRFRGFVVRKRTIEPNAFRESGFVDLRAHHIPALTQVHHPTMEFTRPTLGRYPHSGRLGHFKGPLCHWLHRHNPNHGRSPQALLLKVVSVDLDETTPLFRDFILGVDGIDRAGINARSAVDACVGIDEVLVGRMQRRSGCNPPGRPPRRRHP